MVEAPSPSEAVSHAQRVDVAIVGAGPAGMAAAVAVRKQGATVVLLDEQRDVGGQIYRGINDVPASRLDILGPDYGFGSALSRAFMSSGAKHIRGAAVWQVASDRQVSYLRDGVMRSVEAGAVLLCTGAMERPFPIPGWTLPGVMTAGAGQILLKGSGMVPAQPVVLAGCGPLLYLLGWQYVRAGVPIAALVDTTCSDDYRRALRHAGAALSGWRYLKKGLSLLAALKIAGVPFFKGATGLHVLGDCEASGLGFSSGGVHHEVHSPLVMLHQGVVPNTQLSWALRARHVWDEAQLCWAPAVDAWGMLDVPGVFIAGDSGGIGGARVAALQGELAGLAAAALLGKIDVRTRDRLSESVFAEMRGHQPIRPFLDALYRPKKANRIPADNTIVCRCEEVTAGDIRGDIAMGYTSPNQVKSFGRCGMGPCQGRQCGLTVTELVADASGVSPGEVGYFRIRPPIKPITLGELAHAV